MLSVTFYVHLNVPTPILGIGTCRDIAMKGGIRPIQYAFNVAVFQWIHMHIIHMPAVIDFITN